MGEISISSQLNTFTTVKNILKANSTLSAKFRDSDYYQFEPLLKSRQVRLPFMVIQYPNTDTSLTVIIQLI